MLQEVSSTSPGTHPVKHETTTNDIAEFRFLGMDGENVVLGIPGTEYRLSMRLGEGASMKNTETGKRIRGKVRGEALKAHNPSAGGNFIEPVHGHPRIVQGTVIATSPGTGDVLIDLVVPVWIRLTAAQSASAFTTGDLLNFYMNSGITFTPVE